MNHVQIMSLLDQFTGRFIRSEGVSTKFDHNNNLFSFHCFSIIFTDDRILSV